MKLNAIWYTISSHVACGVCPVSCQLVTATCERLGKEASMQSRCDIHQLEQVGSLRWQESYDTEFVPVLTSQTSIGYIVKGADIPSEQTRWANFSSWTHMKRELQTQIIPEVKPACDSCRIFGAAVFFSSGIYMVLESLRSGRRGTKLFYGITASALMGLGSYRLLKPPNPLSARSWKDCISPQWLRLFLRPFVSFVGWVWHCCTWVKKDQPCDHVAQYSWDSFWSVCKFRQE